MRLGFIIFLFYFKLCAVETFTESVNSYNEFMNPKESVNIYSGDVAFVENLFTLPGIGMDIPITMRYSSNVHLNARTRNDMAPTKWVGLGWQLSYGSVFCDHKGTKSHDDDIFQYVSQEGVESTIKKLQGLNYSYYHGTWSSMPTDFGTAVGTGRINNFNLDAHLRSRNDNFAYRFEGTIDISTAGDYTFFTNSDDGSKLFVKKRGTWVTVVDNDEVHALRERSGVINLPKGNYGIRVDYFNTTGDRVLEVKYQGPSISKSTIPDTVLFPCEPSETLRRWYIEKDPFTLPEPKDIDSDGIFDGWIFTMVDGKKLYYGNLTPEDTSSTRHTFRWGDFVGQSAGGNPDLYPYQWDLAREIDPCNNFVMFDYYRVGEAMTAGSWDSRTYNKYYTKASYLRSMSTQQGWKAEFIRGTTPGEGAVVKTDKEYYDKNVLRSEPDGIMEAFETLLLNTVRFFSPSGDLLRSFDLQYYKINESIPGQYVKSLLKKIIERGMAGTVLNTRSYSYYDDISNVDEASADYDPNYNYGAMKSRVTPLGAVETYTYERKNLTNVRAKDITLLNRNAVALYNGMTKDGNPYCAVIEKDRLARYYFSMYNWDGGAWIEQDYLPESPLGPTEDDSLVCYIGDEYIIILGGEMFKNKMTIYNWDGEKWNNTFPAQYMAATWTDSLRIFPGNNFFILNTSRHCYPDSIDVWNWNGVSWTNTFPRQKVATCIEACECTVSVATGENFFALRQGEHLDRLSVYSWDGTAWIVDANYNNKQMAETSDFPISVQSYSDYITIRSGRYSSCLQILRRQGDSWVESFPVGRPWGTDLDGGVHRKIEAFPGNDFVAVQSGVNENFLTLINWNGQTWELDPDFNNTQMSRNELVWFYPGKDYLTCTTWDRINILGWNGLRWVDAKSPEHLGHTMQTISLAQGGYTVGAYARCATRECDYPDVFKVFNWDGFTWETVFDGFYPDAYRARGCATANESFYAMSPPYRPESFSPVFLAKKFGNVLGEDVYTYVVSKINIHDGVKPIETEYEYDAGTGMYDTRYGTAKFNFTKVKIKDNGYISKYFFNDTKNNGQDTYTNYDKLDGFAYRICVYNEENKLIKEKKMGYEVYREPAWPVEVYKGRLTSLKTITHGVNEIQYITYNAINGLPQTGKTINSDRKEKVTSKTFSFEIETYKDGMGLNNFYMLQQPCKVTTLGWVPDGLGGMTSYPLSSTVTTWTNTMGTNTWVPHATYVWKTAMNSQGLPVNTLSNFNFENPVDNSANGWVKFKTNTKFNSKGIVTEVATAGPNNSGREVYSAAVVRDDQGLTISSIANSRFDECGVFTCDYNINENGYFDYQNGWKHYNNTTFPSGAVCAIESPTPLHFGEKCLHVKNCQAAAKTVVVHSPTAKISWSAWVRPIDDKPIRFAASLVENGVGNHNVFYDYEYNTSKGLKKDGTWQFVKFAIDISKPVSGTLPSTFDGNDGDGIYIWVGNHEYEPASDFYIEDIRIYPAKSLVTTTYYDPKWQQPVLTVDANGNPSQKVVYDEFGRPVRWYKINKTTANLTLLQEKEYHLMGDFFNPNPNKWYKIVTDVDENFCIDIEGPTWTDGQNIHLLTYVGNESQLWKFASAGDGYYNIVNKGGSTFGIDDPYGNITNGTQLKIWTVTGDNQKWKLTDAGEGFCRISAKASDAAFIDLEDGNAANGSKLQIWQSGTYNRWKLVLVE